MAPHEIDEDLSEMSYFVKMHQGHIRGTFLMGQNPAAGGPNARLHRDALRRLDWLVVRDFFRDGERQLLVRRSGR